MPTVEPAIRLQDLMVLVRTLKRRVTAGDAARDPAQIATDIEDLVALMIATLNMSAHHRYSLDIAQSLVRLNRPAVALDRLADILR
jgi:hypothetical protein